MTITMAAPRSCARRERSAQTNVEKMRGRHDHRDPSGDVLQDFSQDGVALLVGEHELLREIREDAQPLRAGIDHAVNGALLAL